MIFYNDNPFYNPTDTHVYGLGMLSNDKMAIVAYDEKDDSWK